MKNRPVLQNRHMYELNGPEERLMLVMLDQIQAHWNCPSRRMSG
jgi:hypothetical protein